MIQPLFMEWLAVTGLFFRAFQLWVWGIKVFVDFHGGRRDNTKGISAMDQGLGPQVEELTGFLSFLFSSISLASFSRSPTSQ